MTVRRFIPLLVAFLLLIPIASVAQFDELGNDLNVDPGPDPGQIGFQPEICGDCKDPDTRVWGVAFRNGEMWVVDLRRRMFRLIDCEPVSEIPLTGTVLTAGLGYDATRDVFILTDASFNSVFQVTPGGRLLAQWPTPGPGPVGAAYDPGRDLYWVSDWEEDRLYSIDPKTGLPGPSITIPAGSRISGLAYDAALDALIYHSRDEGVTYWISVETQDILGVYAVPFAGRNNGAGAGLDPENRTLWVSHSEDPRVFCERGLVGGTRRGSQRARPGRRFQALTSPQQPSGGAPTLFSTSPNPFNPATEIRFALPEASRAVVTIYDARGTHIATLLNAVRPSGEHRVRWDAGDAPSGVYFCRLTVDGFSQTRKMVLLK